MRLAFRRFVGGLLLRTDVGVETSFFPPVNPNTQMSSTTAKRMFHAVVKSCCPTEYAVAVVESVTPFREATLKAWWTPTPPGVTETVLAIELPPTTDMIVWKVTGIEYAARKTAITPSFAHHEPNSGRKARKK